MSAKRGSRIRNTVGTAVAIGLLWTGSAHAGFGYFRLIGNEGRPGDRVEIRVTAENEFHTSSWSFGVCHDSTVATVADVTSGDSIATLNGGNPPDFQQVNLVADGWSLGCVVSFLGMYRLNPGRNHDFYRAEYDLEGPAGSETTLEFCDTIGVPPVAVVISGGGASLVPGTEDSELRIVEAGVAFRAPFDSFPYVAGAPATANASLELETYESTTSTSLTGLSFSLAYPIDPLTVLDLQVSDSLWAAVDIDFFGLAVYPEGIAGTIEFSGEPELPMGVLSVFDVTFETTIVDGLGRIDPLVWVDGIGVPFVVNSVDTSNGPLPVVRQSGYLRWVAVDSEWIRGDCDGSGGVDLGDPVRVLNYLFSGGTAECLAACDAQANSTIDLADALWLLSFLFTGGAPPLAPWPDCGPVATFTECDVSGC